MHYLLFAMKRAYHRGLAKAAPLVRKFGLTPARYDLMLLLFTDGAPDGFRWRAAPMMTQMELRRQLGVSRETVRRMLEGLEERGYVVREQPPPSYRDRRTRIVNLTDLGRGVIRRATKLLFPDGLLSDDRPIRREPLHLIFERASALDIVDLLWNRLRDLARSLGDLATLAYPTFHPDG